MQHPKYPAIHKAMQKLIPTMRQRAHQNGLYRYKYYLAHEWVRYLLNSDQQPEGYQNSNF
jgi:hypothetical protein